MFHSIYIEKSRGERRRDRGVVGEKRDKESVCVQEKILSKGRGEGVFRNGLSLHWKRSPELYWTLYPVRSLTFNQGLGNPGRWTPKARHLRAPASESQFQSLPRAFLGGGFDK